MSAVGGLERVSQVAAGNTGPATGYRHSGPALTAGGGSASHQTVDQPEAGEVEDLLTNFTSFSLSYSVNMILLFFFLFLNSYHLLLVINVAVMTQMYQWWC